MRRGAHMCAYLVWLVGQILAATGVIVRDMVRVHTTMQPIILLYPLRVTTDWEMFVLSTSITMTPGTLSMGYEPARTPGGAQLLRVHAVYGAHPSAVCAAIADMEARIAPHVATKSYGAPGQGDTPRDAPLPVWMFVGSAHDHYGDNE